MAPSLSYSPTTPQFFLHHLFLLILATPFLASTAAAALSLPPSLGQPSTIPSWKIQSSTTVGDDAVALSSPGLDTSSWYETKGSKATLVAALLESGVYNDTALFFSDNLAKVDQSAFQVPWFYRAEFGVGSVGGNGTGGGGGNGSTTTRVYQLKTNGISSRADVFVNGELVVGKDVQAGAYTGRSYDITGKVLGNGGGNGTESNVLLIKVYPTDYNRDFALGFVDWNPYPPDNGTGVWRDVQIAQTGAVGIEDVSVKTELSGEVKFGVDVRRWASSGDLEGEVECTILDPQGQAVGKPQAPFKFVGDEGNGQQQKVVVETKISDPQIWWPKQWGAQPLYNATCTVSTSSPSSKEVSDTSSPVRFGIRTVSSSLNAHDDILFTVNNHPFQALGAGYTSDIFLRFSPSKLRAQFQLVLDMGLNTVRLEGKQEHAELYTLADEMGIMLMAGWECCDKWEGWTYNDEGSGLKWTDADYGIANASMRHEAALMQSHPSMLAFLVGSDFWPDDRATDIYVAALRAHDWDVPIVSSASQRGFPVALGNGGMKMEGPYDWVPPIYWTDTRLGAAFGFGSELGAGVGTPEIESLSRFLNDADLQDLWQSPNKGLYHMSTSVSAFYTREIYNEALWARYGAPTSLDDYLQKVQMADYEATRAQFDAFVLRWSDIERPATGLIYWMLNNAWPSLHWNLFDYYLRAAGSYYGVKAAIGRSESVVYDYRARELHLVYRGLVAEGRRSVAVELMDTKGVVLGTIGHGINATATPNSSHKLPLGTQVPDLLEKIQDVAFLRVLLKDGEGTGGKVLSRNVYWLSAREDVLDWDASTWYHTPVTSFANFTALNGMDKAEVDVSGKGGGKVGLENKGSVPAVFLRLGLYSGDNEVRATWSENYVTLWPGESVELDVAVHGDDYEGGEVVAGGAGGLEVRVSGKNVDAKRVKLDSVDAPEL